VNMRESRNQKDEMGVHIGVIFEYKNKSHHTTF